MHGHEKHIDVHFLLLGKFTKDESVKMVHCHTQEQVSDTMTKLLKLDVFLRMCDLMNVCFDPNVN